MKSILTAVAALIVLAMPVYAADKPAATTDADYEKAKEACKGDAKCLSDLEANKNSTKAQ